MPHERLSRALDALVDRFGAGALVDEAARAREEYHQRTGRVFEDDELYEARTHAFLEWYVVERPLPSEGVAPVVVALREAAAEDEHVPAWRAWARTHRSIFSVEELPGPREPDGTVLLLDLVGGGHFEVAERRRLHGVVPGDLVEARLIGWNDEVCFGRTFCFHPAGARAALERHAQRILDGGGTRLDVTDFAASLRVRAERYRHVAPVRVYEAATHDALRR